MCHVLVSFLLIIHSHRENSTHRLIKRKLFEAYLCYENMQGEKKYMQYARRKKKKPLPPSKMSYLFQKGKAFRVRFFGKIPKTDLCSRINGFFSVAMTTETNKPRVALFWRNSSMKMPPEKSIPWRSIKINDEKHAC